MFRDCKKERLNPTVTKMVIDAPFIAKSGARPVHHSARVEDSERIPLTIADYDRQERARLRSFTRSSARTTMELNPRRGTDAA